ncbi:hypothetical protein AYK26_06815 [Euryarchaeota archaeon SM23-78]|nr:MAG: hypothetical protein AYK26_06815 [Euryarchaeota archaeon SM23-78]MBW3000374.1 hypothetical protein [Candidatus Woesearchaeota archaeon]
MNKKKLEHELKCDGYSVNEKGSEIEMAVTGANVSLSRLLTLIRNYNEKKQKDVNITDFYEDTKTIFGRNQELPSNLLGIYFFGEIKKENVVFRFYKDNQTLDYLKGFVQIKDTVQHPEIQQS